MALNLGALVGAAKQAEDQASVADRWQHAGNNVASGVGQILGYLYGRKLMGGFGGGNKGIGGGNNGIGQILSYLYGGNNGVQPMTEQKNSISNIMEGQ